MKSTLLRPILSARFRANPALNIILTDRLPQSQREKLRELVNEEEYYGVLRKSGGAGQPDKVIDHETALLFLTMREPGPMPDYVTRKFGEDCNRAVAELVLDGVLEIEDPSTGEFVVGAAAHSLLYVPGERRRKSDNRLVHISRQALAYAARLPLDDVNDVASRLYRYNTIPFSPKAREAWPRQSLTSLWLTHVDVLDRWHAASPEEKGKGWLSFSARNSASAENGNRHLPFKLYISPRPEALRELWPVILQKLALANVPSFKIGGDAQMVFRPDKLVAYLPDFASLSQTASLLREGLNGSPAQGVPFTAPIDEAGLLSWGMDPRKEFTANGRQIAESWRSWIVKELAGAIVEAKSSPAAIEPVDFALDKLRLQGIDSETWVPKQSMWSSTRGRYASTNS